MGGGWSGQNSRPHCSCGQMRDNDRIWQIIAIFGNQTFLIGENILTTSFVLLQQRIHAEENIKIQMPFSDLSKHSYWFKCSFCCSTQEIFLSFNLFQKQCYCALNLTLKWSSKAENSMQWSSKPSHNLSEENYQLVS